MRINFAGFPPMIEKGFVDLCTTDNGVTMQPLLIVTPF